MWNSAIMLLLFSQIVDGPTNATPFASLVSHQVVLILLTVSSLVVL